MAYFGSFVGRIFEGWRGSARGWGVGTPSHLVPKSGNRGSFKTSLGGGSKPGNRVSFNVRRILISKTLFSSPFGPFVGGSPLGGLGGGSRPGLSKALSTTRRVGHQRPKSSRFGVIPFYQTSVWSGGCRRLMQPAVRRWSVELNLDLSLDSTWRFGACPSTNIRLRLTVVVSAACSSSGLGFRVVSLGFRV